MDNLPVIAIRFMLYADLLVLTGMTAFSLYALSAEERKSAILPLMKPAGALAVAGFLLSGIGMLALVGSMTGSGIWAVDGQTLQAIISESAIGNAWVVRIVALAIAVISALALNRSSAAHYFLLVSTSIAIATLVWIGHAGATEGSLGRVHRISDIFHMLASAVWIGGIAAFAWMLFRPLTVQSHEYVPIVHRALERFSWIGTLAVGAIVATGIFNFHAVVGFSHLTQLLQSGYGKLLIIKLLLFAGMLALAALNRWRLTPALEIAIRDSSPAAAITSLRRSLLVESTAALAILALVAWLGTLEPLSGAR